MNAIYKEEQLRLDKKKQEREEAEERGRGSCSKEYDAVDDRHPMKSRIGVNTASFIRRYELYSHVLKIFFQRTLAIELPVRGSLQQPHMLEDHFKEINDFFKPQQCRSRHTLPPTSPSSDSCPALPVSSRTRLRPGTRTLRIFAFFPSHKLLHLHL